MARLRNVPYVALWHMESIPFLIQRAAAETSDAGRNERANRLKPNEIDNNRTTRPLPPPDHADSPGAAITAAARGV
jgi:hypothetical protein